MLNLLPRCRLNTLTFELQSRIDAILSWVSNVSNCWAHYDRHVHKFIRNAIDMDKTEFSANACVNRSVTLITTTGCYW